MNLSESNLIKGSTKGKLTPGWITLFLPIILSKVAGLMVIPISILVRITLGSLLQSSSLRFIIGIIISTGATIIIYFLYVKFIERRSVKSLGFNLDKSSIIKYIKGFIFGGVLILIATLLISLTGAVEFRFIGLHIRDMVPFVLMLVAWLIQGASEEIMIRGHMMPVLSIKWGVVISLIISSCYFSALHLGNSGINYIALLNLAIFGVLMGLYALYDDGLWGVCALHSAWNFVQGNIVGSLVSGITVDTGNLFRMRPVGNEILSGGAFGVEGSIITTFVGIIGIIIITMLIKKKKTA